MGTGVEGRRQVRGRVRKVRLWAKCNRCGAAVLAGALVQYHGQKVCAPCLVALIRGRDPRQERRMEAG